MPTEKMIKKKKVQVELPEDVYKELEDLIAYFKVRQQMMNRETTATPSIQALIVGAILEFLKNFRNQKNMNYNADYEKIAELVNINNFASEGNLKNRFKEYMYQKRITQKQLSNSTGIAKSSISQYINNKNQMSLDTFLKIWVAIECPPIEEILYRE